MRLIGVLIALCLKILFVENVMISLRYLPDEEESQEENIDDENHKDNPFKKVESNDSPKTTIRYNDYEGGRNYYNNPLKDIELKDLQNTSPNNDYESGSTVPETTLEKKGANKDSKTCSVIVASDSQNSAMQSLLRKYRYDSNGALIPSSVKYYIKMPQSFGSKPILIPLMNKAISPLGGFVRLVASISRCTRLVALLRVLTLCY